MNMKFDCTNHIGEYLNSVIFKSSVFTRRKLHKKNIKQFHGFCLKASEFIKIAKFSNEIFIVMYHVCM